MKVEQARPRTSRAGPDSEAGFTLVEVIAVLALIALLAAIIVPALPRGTSRAKLEAYAVETAALLKADRAAAMRRRVMVATEVDMGARALRSRATGRAVYLPPDVALEALLARRCDKRPAGSTIRFFASGMSCGGVIALSRDNLRYEVRVNWLTGGVEVVPAHRS